MNERPNPWSATRLDVREHLRDARETAAGVLATVVAVEGSAYRRPGAKLVVEDGGHVGAITAGCLEGPLLDLAKDVRESGTARVETFDFTDDDEWGIGLGCNGVIDVLLEPIDASFDRALGELDARRPAAVVTVVESDADEVPVGARATRTTDGAFHGSEARRAIPATVLDDIADAAVDALDAGRSSVETVTVDGDRIRMFIDGLRPAHELVLFGSQNDIHPVSQFARQVGFRVVVASARGAHSEPDQFPAAHEVRSVRAPDLAAAVEDDDYTSVVLMSHNFIDDRLALESLLADTSIPYVGLMGPRKRFERMREEMAADGVTLTEADLSRIATPVGLDLGGGEPVEIATSIVGEVLAVSNGRSGGRLSEQQGPIHTRAEELPNP